MAIPTTLSAKASVAARLASWSYMDDAESRTKLIRTEIYKKATSKLISINSQHLIYRCRNHLSVTPIRNWRFLDVICRMFPRDPHADLLMHLLGHAERVRCPRRRAGTCNHFVTRSHSKRADTCNHFVLSRIHLATLSV